MKIYANNPQGLHGRAWEKELPEELERRTDLAQNLADKAGDSSDVTRLGSLRRNARQATSGAPSTRSLTAVGVGVAAGVAGTLAYGWPIGVAAGFGALFLTSEALLLGGKIKHEHALDDFSRQVVEKHSSEPQSGQSSRPEPWGGLESAGYATDVPVRGPLKAHVASSTLDALEQKLDQLEQSGLHFYTARSFRWPGMEPFEEQSAGSVAGQVREGGSEFSRTYYAADKHLTGQVMAEVRNLHDLEVLSALRLGDPEPSSELKALQNLVAADFRPATERYDYEERYQPTPAFTVYQAVIAGSEKAGLRPPGADGLITFRSPQELLALDFLAGSGNDRALPDRDLLVGLKRLGQQGYEVRRVGSERHHSGVPYGMPNELGPFYTYRSLLAEPDAGLWLRSEGEEFSFPVTRAMIADRLQFAQRQSEADGIHRAVNPLLEAMRVDWDGFAEEVFSLEQLEPAFTAGALARITRAYYQIQHLDGRDAFKQATGLLGKMTGQTTDQERLDALLDQLDLMVEFLPPETVPDAMATLEPAVAAETRAHRTELYVALQQGFPDGPVIDDSDRLADLYRDQAQTLFQGPDVDESMAEIREFLTQRRKQRLMGEILDDDGDGGNLTIDENEDQVVVGGIPINKKKRSG